ncbi:MAG: sulfite exporter TauE/SafE family protein, partial [Candidatus Omnitrophica bacterium]|nr:sulfite exporter TauE/SafE family protein [Candidatus Omnitrophota bacterium]
MLRICISLFVTGMIMGSGPCLASCGPILVSYIAATKRSPLGGLWGCLVFSASRVLVYIFMGGIAGFVGAGLFSRFYWEMPGYIILFVSGLFISFLGVLIFSGKE